MSDAITVRLAEIDERVEFCLQHSRPQGLVTRTLALVDAPWLVDQVRVLVEDRRELLACCEEAMDTLMRVCPDGDRARSTYDRLFEAVNGFPYSEEDSDA